MGLGLTPRDYLEMLTEEYREYQEHWHAHGYRVSMRKAIKCCGLSNALPEIIFAQYEDTQPLKVHHTKDHYAYRREYLEPKCQAHSIVKDLCEFSKHGPKLRRLSERAMKGAKRITRPEGFFRGLLLLMENHEVERLEITYQDSRTELMDEILEQVTASWKEIFEQDKL